MTDSAWHKARAEVKAATDREQFEAWFRKRTPGIRNIAARFVGKHGKPTQQRQRSHARSQPHHDYWPEEDWAAIAGGGDQMNELQNTILKEVWDRTKAMWDGIPELGIPPMSETVLRIKRLEERVNALSAPRST